MNSELWKARSGITRRAQAERAIERCLDLARYTEQPGRITRTFLSPPMKGVHECFSALMADLHMQPWIDAAGNLRGRTSNAPDRPALIIGSHLDTVPNAGAFDGILGVILGMALVEAVKPPRPFDIEVVGFSEEEGVRFGVPFLGSRAFAGTFDPSLLGRSDTGGVTVAEAIRSYGLDPAAIADARLNAPALGYLEFHIEQGPVLDKAGKPLAVVEGIAGQTRIEIAFTGQNNHAGTTPMGLRRDALAGLAEWMLTVEKFAKTTEQLVATVGKINVTPNASNVIPGQATATLDVRHGDDRVRRLAVENLGAAAQEIAAKRALNIQWTLLSEQCSVMCDASLTAALLRAIQRIGAEPIRMMSGAGHDAMIMAPIVPMAMLFLRSPGGISHHPDESVRVEDVELAIEAGVNFMNELARVN